MKRLGNRKISCQKIIVILLGIVFSILMLELGLRLGGLIFISFQEYSNRVSLYKKGTYRIMCLGESTTAIGGKDSYPSQLEEILNQRNIGIKFSVINKGVPVVNTYYILAHLEENLNQYQPDLVTVMMGSNDDEVKYYEDIPEARTTLFNKFSTYRFLRILWMNMVNKMKKIGIYKSEEKAKAVLLPSNISAAGLKWQAEALKGTLESNPKDNMAYLELGRFYRKCGEFVQAEKTLRKAIELNPRNDSAYIQLGKVYRDQEKFPQAEEAFKKAIELNPKDDTAYIQLGRFYRDNFMKPIQAEQAFKEAIELNPKDYEAYVELGRLCTYYGKFTQAEESFKKAIELDPRDDMVYKGFAALYSEMGKDKLAEEYYRKANPLRLGYYSLMTAHNYQELKMILDKRGIKLVCVQYPMCSIEPLKMMLQGQEGVIFVDNEKVFKDALKKGSLKDYFIDMFAGDFGHCTRKGNRLLAENIANVILKEVFGR